MPGDAFTQGRPQSPPAVVTILAQGVASHIAGGTFNPLTVDDYCTTLDGLRLQARPKAQGPLADMNSEWINSFDPSHMAPYGASGNPVDAAASGGGLVLPFSYGGATLKSGPVFSVTGYSASKFANTSPAAEATLMNAEITSIHKVWPNARIVVVGHSNGGLIGELWWLDYGSKNPSHVTQVFSLDSPLNGVANGFCSTALTGYLCDKGFGVGKTLAGFYAALWKNQASNDAAAVALDAKDKLFTAVGTDGDPLYDLADSFTAQIGPVLQFLYPAACAGNSYHAGCLPAGRWYMDPCSPLNDGSTWPFKMSGDIWMHSVVKNCVTGKIMQYVN
jgi:Alpha/beta hydrolase of unknown function (DUF915)